MRRRQHLRVPVPPAVSGPVTAAGSRSPVPAPAAAEPLIPQPGLVPNQALPPGALSDPADVEREAGVARLFELHYSSMLRLAVLLGADDPENVVAERTTRSTASGGASGTPRRRRRICGRRSAI